MTNSRDPGANGLQSHAAAGGAGEAAAAAAAMATARSARIAFAQAHNDPGNPESGCAVALLLEVSDGGGEAVLTLTPRELHELVAILERVVNGGKAEAARPI